MPDALPLKGELTTSRPKLVYGAEFTPNASDKVPNVQSVSTIMDQRIPSTSTVDSYPLSFAVIRAASVAALFP